MKTFSENTLYTIGHSTHSLDELIAMLNSFEVKNLVDVRRFPGSRKFPHFDKENLEISLPNKGIKYIHLQNLGGRRKVDKDSKNTRWRNDSFRAYADYMETEDFEKGMKALIKIATHSTTAIMCAEAVWWRCHRALVSDYLKAKSWNVLHIMNKYKADEHPFTSPARVVEERVFYSDENLFDQA